MFPRVTIAAIALAGVLGAILPGVAAGQAPSDPPEATVRPGGGPVGSKILIRVTGIGCPSGQPLLAAWDAVDVIGASDNAGDAAVEVVIGAVVPKSGDGVHTIWLRCGQDGRPLVATRFTVTDQPYVSVDPASVLAGSAFEIDLINFRCTIESAVPVATTVDFDNIELTPPFVIPSGTRPGRHVVRGRCAWPADTKPPQAATVVWVPGLLEVAPGHGPAGREVRLTGAGFNCPAVRVSLDGVPIMEAKTTAADRERQGLFTAAVTVPTGTAGGPHAIAAWCPPFGARPEAVYTVDAPSPSPETSDEPVIAGGLKPSGWIAIAGLAVAALALLLGGTYLVRRPPRRRPRAPGVQVRLALGMPQIRVREEGETA